MADAIDLEFDGTNREPRCACILVLDTSGSMGGDPIRELNDGLREFKTAWMDEPMARSRVETSIISFNSTVNVVTGFTDAQNFQPPTLVAQGSTFMGSALLRGLEKLEERKRIYKQNKNPYYRPWLLLLTDGQPAGEPDSVFEEAKRRIRAAETGKNVVFWGIGVQGANMAILDSIGTNPGLKLAGLRFVELFQWLSSSIGKSATGAKDEQKDYAPADASLFVR